MRIPLEFICFGITKGKMYSSPGLKNTFISVSDNITLTRNFVVYGALFLCKDFDFYCRILDAYHLCSLSTLLRNHPCDELHRVNIPITPIYFDTLDELQRLLYRESTDSIQAQTYTANTNNPKILNRMNTTVNSYRITSGIDADNFKKLFWEVRKCF
jgi:hypothetical protein